MSGQARSQISNISKQRLRSEVAIEKKKFCDERAKLADLSKKDVVLTFFEAKDFRRTLINAKKINFYIFF